MFLPPGLIHTSPAIWHKVPRTGKPLSQGLRYCTKSPELENRLVSKIDSRIAISRMNHHLSPTYYCKSWCLCSKRGSMVTKTAGLVDEQFRLKATSQVQTWQSKRCVRVESREIDLFRDRQTEVPDAWY